MTEVEATPPRIGQQDTHPVRPTSPKKRSFKEINGLEEVRTGSELAAPTFGQQNTHPASPASPRKRSFEQLHALEEVKPENELTAPVVPHACSPLEPTAVTQNGLDPLPPTTNPCIPPLRQSQAVPIMAAPDSESPAVPASDHISQPQLSAAPSEATTGGPPAPSDAPSPKKKVKLTPAEKEAKEKQKAEERAKKEEEKRVKDEEKKKREEEREEKRRQREEEREEKRKLKEEEKQAREEEKRKKEEEKGKKERSQMRLNAFFTKPAVSTNQSGGDGSLVSTGKYDDDPNVSSERATSDKQRQSDYEKKFPSFFLKSHVKLAPPHRFQRDTGGLTHAREKIDKGLKDGEFAATETFNPTGIFRIMPYKRRQGRLTRLSVKEILASMQDSSLNHIDLTGDKGAVKHTTRLEDILKEIPMKTLKFGEDVRPPYQGTFTKRLPEEAAVKLSRNPFLRAIHVLNYDYDSEAEWEEPEEGEDLSTEGEDDASDDGDDDMDDFLDDAGDQVKRKTVMGDLEPICSGIRWDDGAGADTALQSFKMEVISETLSFPIDPFSDTYWKKPTAQSNSSPFKVPDHPADNSNPSAKSKPSLQFLHYQANPSLPKFSDPTTAVHGNNSTGQPQKPRIPFPPDQLSEFKSVVSDSDLTKAGLIEVLKKRFPKVSKEVIRDTLNAVAARRGQKEVDKRWVLI